MPMDIGQPILVIEDSDDDFEVLMMAFKAIEDFNYRIDRCTDGKEAIEYLFRKGPYESLEEYNLPGLILLDLTLPGSHGMELLDLIKTSRKLSHIPTIIFTSFDNDKIARECYSSGVNSFIVKPMEFRDTVQKISQTCNYWLNIASLPKPRFRIS
ncbi:response regulator [Sneathiella limimaris]|uniref:response regulator n=1 Tax=Sneathiella limimaris TaxID=1964213 RepID=UPI00146D6152|nr:response regulator [Sneathiella limimaris]